MSRTRGRGIRGGEEVDEVCLVSVAAGGMLAL